MRGMILMGAVLAACSGKATTDDSAEWWEGNESPDGETPVIREGSVYCTPGSQSSGDLFFVEIEAYDPQGDGDIADQGGRVAGYYVDSDEEIFDDELLVCTGASCQGSWRDGIYPPVTCATHDYFYFKAWVLDRDGNTSPEYDLAWN
ncbi:MAG: hypothetical protein H6739_01265 [Alphaproteobacteria bacterium]|nr:hypothetical protein [Alphaproteobacteria bacterium]